MGPLIGNCRALGDCPFLLLVPSPKLIVELEDNFCENNFSELHKKVVFNLRITSFIQFVFHTVETFYVGNVGV